MAGNGEGKSVSHSLYCKLIRAAIGALGEGCTSKSEISDYIESTYEDLLPDDHEDDLLDALNSMKKDGELQLQSDNYVIATAAPTARRGRGRPPKPKVPPPPGVSPPTPRSRGRPPKAKDPLAAAIAKATSGLPRPRGRPRTKDRPAVGGSPAKSKAGQPKPAVVGMKRGRGRPRK